MSCNCFQRTYIRRLGFFFATLMLAALPPAPRVLYAQMTGGQGGAAVPRSLFGAWRVTTSRVAPWVGADSASVDRTRYLKHTVQLGASAVSGLESLSCTAPKYESTAVPPEALFQGNLPAPAADVARALGFAKGTVHGMRLMCETGTFEFHIVDAMHLLVAIDNVIWTLDRSPGALASASTPKWAELAWAKESVTRGLVKDSTVKPVMLMADFDGDGQRDVAWLVRKRTTGARGVLIVHASGRVAQQCGAGVKFGNGGTNFDWMDSWKVVPGRNGKGSALLVEKAESASGRIEFRAGRYQWIQVGD